MGFMSGDTDPNALSTNGHTPPQEPGPPQQDDDAEIKQLRVLGLFDMFNKKPPPPLVHDLLDEDALTFFVGAEGSGKSFLALSLACAVANQHGMDFWEGRKIYKHGPVFYIAAEGASGLGTRIKVWCETNNVDPMDLVGNMHFMDEAIPLEDPVYRELLRREIERLQPVLIVIDTKSALTSGFEENSSNEQQQVINYLKRLKKISGACILVIHHLGKGGDQRGSNVWPTNVDDYLIVLPNTEEFEPEADRPLVVFCSKHKERVDKCSHEFILKMVRDEFGKPRSRVILQPQHHPDYRPEQEKGAEYRKRALTLLQETGALTQPEWVRLLVAEGMNRATAYRGIKSLLDAHMVHSDGGKPEKFSA